MRADLWQRGCERLAAELPDQQFNTWIRPLDDAEVTDRGDAGATVTIRVPNRFKLDWIRAQYAGKIETALSDIAGKPVQLDITLAPRDVAPRSLASMLPPTQGQPTPRGEPAIPARNGHAPFDSGFGALQPSRSRLNPALSFDTLVPGRANQMARTAALHVAGAPGQMYNPLFIYGGVGLGKTHLIHAVGNALLADRPDARILYLHADQFITDVVKNYQRKTFDELKSKYHSLDLLLIDDVQFFAGKERTQEEFFNAFEALLAKRAHIIMTSDTYPKGLADIDERLTSRFDAGLTVAIEPPELEMRVAILMKKADQRGRRRCPRTWPSSSPRTCAPTCASSKARCARSWRTRASRTRTSTSQLAREALKDLLSIQNRQVGVENIQKTVADFYKIKVADMYSKKRPASIARPRQIAMYLAKEMTQKSLPEIGELFGGRDHTTVLHAVRKIGGGAPEEPRAEPAAARARTDAERLMRNHRSRANPARTDRTAVKAQPWGQRSMGSGSCPQAGTRFRAELFASGSSSKQIPWTGFEAS